MTARQAQTNVAELLAALREAREHTLALVSDLNDKQLMGPRLGIVNPLRWEIAHVAWFQEFWLLRHLGGEPPILTIGDELYDSARVAHDTRWDIPLLSRADTLAYMREVLTRIADCCQRTDYLAFADASGYGAEYFLHLALFHEQMHDEAFAYTRQTLGYPAPQFNEGVRVANLPLPGGRSTEVQDGALRNNAPTSQRYPGDAHVPGGKFVLGRSAGPAFIFDNEQPAHQVEIAPFSISKTAVANGEYLEFVKEKGHARREFWSEAGWRWRENASAEYPVYWKRDGESWLHRNFDQWTDLELNHAIIHVNWYEADAFCHWAGRRLPTEAEWEIAASAEPIADRSGISNRRKYPWGNAPPTPDRANLDWHAMGCIDVRALPASDSMFGCRQMIGNSWEWTSTDFCPYPGFRAGPYREYSEPWFGDHKVLRGGCWATRSCMITNTYRNFYTPDRRDVWAGFRTCAL